jgi:AAA15 family ATPase/GTPase
MLIEFQVGNFRSFKEPVTLSMVTAPIKAKDKEIDENNVILVDDNLSLLTSAVIYGANASGKSNLVAATAFMRYFVLNSSSESQAEESISIDPFRLSTETDNMPSLFQVVFLLGGTKYRYGFEVSRNQVVSEWLFYVPSTKEARLFMRDEQGIQCARTFKEGRGLAEKTRPNALFLSVVAQFNGLVSGKVLKWFRELGVISGLSDRAYQNFTLRQFEEEAYRQEIVRWVKSFDLGIDDIQSERRIPMPPPAISLKVEAELNQSLPEREAAELVRKEIERGIMLSQRPDQASIKTIHTKYDETGNPVSHETFDLGRQESHGTKKLFYLMGPLIDTLSNGRVLFIDEFEARLHPLITCTLIKLFNSTETNPNHAQLVFTTHDTNLLSNKIFRRDQVWFTEKDSLGATHLYSLAEIKVRNDASFERDYIQGKYGAIPFIGDLQRTGLCEE